MKQTIISSVVAAVIVAALGWTYSKTSEGLDASLDETIRVVVKEEISKIPSPEPIPKIDLKPLEDKISSIEQIANDAFLKSKSTYLQCTETEWGDESGCADWPTASPPSCGAGYEFVGISVETHTDGGCDASARNRQKVKGMCCKVSFR